MSKDDKKEILVIDDDVTIRKLISYQLRSENFLSHEADGPAEGFKKLKDNDIDLVLCDVTMDEMDGFTFCRKVRENENYRMLPFIFVTAKNTMEDKNRAVESGGDDIVTKPFNVKDLLVKIRALLKRTEIYKIYGVKKNLSKTFKSGKIDILFIDDDKTLNNLFRHSLNAEGFDCRTVTNVNEAYLELNKKVPDIIISDIMMPEIDGITFRKEILENDDYKNIPFIFLSSKDTEDDMLEGYNLGITDYVVKNNGPKVITAKVASIIKSLYKEREKVISELHDAVDLMRAKVVPEKSPAFPKFQISHWHKPYQGVPGGDFIDYYKLDENNLAIVLGDVMGKKWGAWYFAFAYAGYVRSSLRGIMQHTSNFLPSEILQKINKSIYDDAKISEVFATLSILILNNSEMTLKYSGAGDLPLVYKDHSSGEIRNIKSDGLLLGFAEEGSYSDIELQLNNNDIAFLFTDGITESMDKNKKQFGLVSFNEILNNLSPENDTLEKIKKELKEYTGDNFEDDVSLICIKCS
jgi:phosphoserine phosphatase RsbU/P